MNGLLIVFEGLDQSGKETQARLLRQWFEARGRQVESLAFPDYATPIGAEIWKGLHGERDFGPDTIQLLLIANRFEWKPKIQEWLAAGRVVICDRYLASSVAYGEAQGLDPHWLTATQAYLPQPDATILLDIAPEVAAARKAKGRDKFESDLPMLGRVRASYLRQAADLLWLVVDAARPVESVAAGVARAVATRLGLV
jgi:dTMP kinase